MNLQRNLKEFIKSYLQEISSTGGAGGYLSKYFIARKPLSFKDTAYSKLGFKPVNRKKLAKSSKVYDYRDLWGSTYDN
jgi:hypothetical protein